MAEETNPLFGGDTFSALNMNSGVYDPTAWTREKLGTLAPVIPNGKPATVDIGNQIAGNFSTGPNPGTKSQGGTLDFVNAANQLLGQPQLWANPNELYGKPYNYGAGIYGANFERYYNHPKFKQLNYNPLRDNEAVYNANSSWWDDFSRMTSSFVPLFGAGFKSMYDFGSKDTSRIYENAMATGMTSKGGIGGFFTNLTLNAGFTMGIATEMLAENFASLAIGNVMTKISTPLKTAAKAKELYSLQKAYDQEKVLGGLRAGITGLYKEKNAAKEIYDLSQKPGRLSKAINFISPFGNTTQFFKDLYAGQNGYDKLGDLAKLSKGFGEFYKDIREINLVFSESTLEGEMYRNEKTRDKIDEFYTRNNRMPTPEEADQIYNDVNSGSFAVSLINAPAIYLTNKIVFDNILRGFKPPSVIGQELLEGSARTLGRNANWKLGDEVYDFLKTDSKGKMAKFLLESPFLPWSKKYMLGNLSEGLQESFQDIIPNATDQYFNGVHKDPASAGFYSALAAVGSSTKNQFSMRGLETFASGYLMGSIVQPYGRLMTSPFWAPQKYKEFTDPESVSKLQQNQQESENQIANAVNTILRDPLAYFDKNVDHALRVKAVASEQNKAMQEGNQKAFQDAKNDLSLRHMLHVARSGKMELVTEQFDALLSMDDTELSQAMNESDTTKVTEIRNRLQDAKSFAIDFQRRFNFWTEKLPNPFNPRAYKLDEDPEAYFETLNQSIGWEKAVEDVILSHEHFDKTLERMEGLYNEVGQSKLLKNATASDMNVLLDSTLSKSEIEVLEREIDVLQSGTPEQKKEAAKKKLKLDSLKDWNNLKLAYDKAYEQSRKMIAEAEKNAFAYSPGSIVEHSATKERLEVESSDANSITAIDSSGNRMVYNKKDIGPVILTKEANNNMVDANRKLHEGWKNYISTLMDVYDDNMINEEANTNAFVKIRDHFSLQQEAKNLNRTINMLSNPEMFMEHARRISVAAKLRTENFAEIIKDSKRKLTEKYGDNQFLNDLFDLRITIDPDDAQSAIVKADFTNVTFYDMVTAKPIDEKDERYTKLKEAVRKYQMFKGVIKEQTAGKPAPKPAQPAAQQAPAQQKVSVSPYTPEVEAKLKELIRNTIQEAKANGDVITLTEDLNDPVTKQWVLTNSSAQAIIKAGKTPAPAPAAAPKGPVKPAKDWKNKPVPAGLQPLKGIFESEVFQLSPDQSTYENQDGSKKAARVSDLKKNEYKDGNKTIEALSQSRGNTIDEALRAFVDGDIKLERAANGELTKAAVTELKDFIARLQEQELKADPSKKQVKLTDKAIKDLAVRVIRIKETFEKAGYKLHTNIPTLWGYLNTKDGEELFAGTVDLMAEKDGKFYIIDLKSNSPAMSRRSESGIKRYREADTLQLMTYVELTRQRSGQDIAGVFILPLTAEHSADYGTVTSIDMDIDETVADETSFEAMTIPIDMSQDVYELDKGAKKMLVRPSEKVAEEPVGGAQSYKGIEIIESDAIKTATGEHGAAKYDRANNKIILNRKFLKTKFDEKAWTKPRKQADGSFATALPENTFKTYEEWENFVIEHEYQHSLLSHQQFDNEIKTNTDIGQYEDEINRRALKELGIKIQAAPSQKTEPSASEPVTQTDRFVEELDKIENINDFNTFFDRAMSELEDSVEIFLAKYNTDLATLGEKLLNKKKQLIYNIFREDLQPGTEVMYNDGSKKGFMKIQSISNTTMVLVDPSGENPVSLPLNELKKYIEFIKKPGMENLDPADGAIAPLDPEVQQKADETSKGAQEAFTDANIKNIVENNKSFSEAKNSFRDSVKRCNTKGK